MSKLSVSAEMAEDLQHANPAHADYAPSPRWAKKPWGAFLACLLAGLMLGGLAVWKSEDPNLRLSREIRAVATQGSGTCAVATGFVQEGIEGLFFLDYLTGDLRGVLINSNSGRFTASFTRNVFGDLNLQSRKETPQLALVVGQINLRKQGPASFADSVVYVVDGNSGIAAAYAIPLAPNAKSRGQNTLEFVLLDNVAFRTAQIRE